MVSLASAAAQVEVHLVRRVCEQSAAQSLQRRVRGKVSAICQRDREQLLL